MVDASAMIRALVSALCILIAAGPAFGQSGAADLTKVKTIALGIPAGSPVTVKMKDGAKLSGRLGPVDNAGFELQTIENGSIVSKTVAFDQIGKLSAGAPVGRLRAMAGPLFRIVTLMGTVGALTAALR